LEKDSGFAWLNFKDPGFCPQTASNFKRQAHSESFSKIPECGSQNNFLRNRQDVIHPPRSTRTFQRGETKVEFGRAKLSPLSSRWKNKGLRDWNEKKGLTPGRVTMV